MWDTALKFFIPVLPITSPDHLVGKRHKMVKMLIIIIMMTMMIAMVMALVILRHRNAF